MSIQQLVKPIPTQALYSIFVDKINGESSNKIRIPLPADAITATPLSVYKISGFLLEGRTTQPTSIKFYYQIISGTTGTITALIRDAVPLTYYNGVIPSAPAVGFVQMTPLNPFPNNTVAYYFIIGADNICDAVFSPMALEITY